MIRVALPAHLRTLAHVDGEVTLEVAAPVTRRAVLDALEAGYPMLRGTIRDQVTHERRAFLRFFACEEDLTHESPDAPLPDAVAAGAEPLLIVGAMAGGAGDRELAITRIIDAPRRRVFRAWTDPARLAQWWGPHGMTTSICEMDVRPGGVLRTVMRDSPASKPSAHAVMTAMVTFEDDDGRTRLTARASLVGRRSPETRGDGLPSGMGRDPGSPGGAPDESVSGLSIPLAVVRRICGAWARSAETA